MKYLIYAFASIFLTTALSFSAEAQLLNRLKKKAQEAAEQKAEEKAAEQVQLVAERMVERSWDSIFGELDGDSVSPKTLPFTTKGTVQTEDEYRFSTITTMEVQTVRKDGSTDPPLVMKMHFNEEELYTGTKFSSEEMQENEELFIIYDFKNSAMLMLMGDKEDKFSFAYNWEEDLESIQTAEQQAGNQHFDSDREHDGYSRIGNKNILGYNCDGYRSENNNQTNEIWVTQDADFGMHTLFKANANTKHLRGKLPEDYPSGMVMEVVAEDSQTGETTTMKVTDIDRKARVNYTMADYPRMNFTSKTSSN